MKGEQGTGSQDHTVVSGSIILILSANNQLGISSQLHIAVTYSKYILWKVNGEQVAKIGSHFSFRFNYPQYSVNSKRRISNQIHIAVTYSKNEPLPHIMKSEPGTGIQYHTVVSDSLILMSSANSKRGISNQLHIAVTYSKKLAYNTYYEKWTGNRLPRSHFSFRFKNPK